MFDEYNGQRITPMPHWFTELRDHQRDAIDEAIDAYQRGVRMVLIDAPTGSGKTVIGEMIRRVMQVRGLYVCHGLELQDQFVRDFKAPVLKGRSNYPTVRGGWDVTADNCGGRSCMYCPSRGDCPYEQAKQAAITGNPAVLNTAYYLTEGNGPGRMKGRQLVVIDEADTLEGELMRWAEFRVSAWGARRAGMRGLPKKGVHWPTLHKWLREYAEALVKAAKGVEHEDPKQARMWRAKAGQVYRFFPPGEDGENWVREYPKYGGEALVLKPVRVLGMGREYLWKLGRQHLLMSATLIGADHMLRDLGWDEDFHVVSVPMTFPVENRPIYVAPVATMTAKGKDAGEWDKMADAVRRVMAQHPDERILVHTVSYDLAKYLKAEVGGWRGMVYADRDSRARTLEAFKQTEGAVLFAPSMDRGIDLPDDLCRVQVVAKLPYPYLGDPRVNARLRAEGGQTWYNLQTIRVLVQMTGRAVRNADDWAVTYILDRQFVRHYSDYKPFLPRWWSDALVMNRSADELLTES